MIARLAELAHLGYARWLTYRIRQRSLAATIRAPFVHGHRPHPDVDPAGRPRPLDDYERRTLELIEHHERTAAAEAEGDAR